MSLVVPAAWPSMGDAAYAANLDGTAFNAVAGYLSSPDDFHTWSETDWQGVPGPKLPIWVAGFDGAGEAESAVVQLNSLGAKNCYVAVDMEGRVDKTYVDGFYTIMRNSGYRVWVYGSASTVFNNPQCNGYWVADYTGRAFMYNHSGVRATQWTNGPLYDQSTVRPWTLQGFWV